MRSSTIILAGLGAVAFAQDTSSQYWSSDLQASITSALEHQSALISSYFATATNTHSYTPEELSSIDSVALSSATAAMGSQSSIIDQQLSSVYSWQASASSELAAISNSIATASGSAKDSLSSHLASVTSEIASISSEGSRITSMATQTTGRVSSAGSGSATTTTTDGGVAPTSRPLFAAGAIGALGLAVVGLL